MNAQPADADFAAVADRVWRRGLVAGTGGNISFRSELRMLIKPSGRSIVDCRLQDLVAVDLAGHMSPGQASPSRDADLHVAIYRARPQIGAIIHVHGPWATALTMLGYDVLPALTPHAREKLGLVEVLPFAASGTASLAETVTTALSKPDARAVLLGRHGVIAAAKTLAAACDIAELVEETAQIAMLLHLATGQATLEPIPVPEGDG